MKRREMGVAGIAGLVLLAGVLLAPAAVQATHGMNLEGYGPISQGMGGISMAYDNGTAAVMNNPATLGLMEEGSSRLDLALGDLAPRVDAIVSTPRGSLKAHSQSELFVMPALGWARKQGAFTYGLGIFAQGGMGTEYAATSWMADPSQGANSALTAGLVNRSEVSMGRALVRGAGVRAGGEGGSESVAEQGIRGGAHQSGQRDDGAADHLEAQPAERAVDVQLLLLRRGIVAAGDRLQGSRSRLQTMH